jgi:hypothetical protein
MIQQATLPPPALAPDRGRGPGRLPQSAGAAGRAFLAVDAAGLPGEPMTENERQQLQENEEKIGRGARAWLEMGVALMAIRDKRLHRETHDSFDAYCWEKFRLVRSVAYGLMAAAKRYELVLPIANRLRIEFTAESQLRPLCRCQAIELPDVLKLAAKKIEPGEDGTRIPTAKILTEAVHQFKARGARPVDKTRNGHTTKSTGPGLPAAGAQNRDGTRAEQQPSDLAPEAITHAMAQWSDPLLLTVARAMAAELKKRGLIKAFDAPQRAR